MSKHIIQIGNIECGSKDLFLISGPCVIEDESLMMQTAEQLKEISLRLAVPLIFKSSFMKDNRSDLSYYTGPGLEEGLKILQKIKTEFDLPVLSDIHYPDQVKPASEVLDVLQIPAYLCMQTVLTSTIAKTNKVINLKHGQFLAPENINKPVQKIIDSGNDKIILTERGFTMGYNDLVVDPRSFYYMKQTGLPVVFDVTHSIRKYGVLSADPKGGSREFMPTLSRAAAGIGIDGIFIEAHPNPSYAKCDAASQMPLHHLEEFLKPILEIHKVASSFYSN